MSGVKNATLTIYFLTGLPPGVRFFLPFTLRALRTLRPPTLDILVLNPDTRALLRLVPPSVQPSPFLLFASTTRVPRRSPGDRAFLNGDSTIPAEYGV